MLWGYTARRLLTAAGQTVEQAAARYVDAYEPFERLGLVLPGLDIPTLKQLLHDSAHDVNRALARHLGQEAGPSQPVAILSLAERIRRNPRQRRTSQLGHDFSGGSDLDSDHQVIDLDHSDSTGPAGSPSRAPSGREDAENRARPALSREVEDMEVGGTE